MPFPEKIREFWLKVAGGTCQYEFYDKRFGWQKCGRPATHVHHITPEGWTKAHGGDPDHNVGMALCREHHTKNLSDEEHNREFAFHPDIGRAFKQYHEWKVEDEHMRHITGKKGKGSPSPFDEAIQEHRYLERHNERYHAGTPEIDDYYEQKMRDEATKWLALHPGEKKPEPHRRGLLRR